ncbi:epoxide hydrolase family protein [Paenibacillus sacheonensis]|uniref:Epoxide hydrolase n=1 Tax=Paenibacillus sacheonensis TaxID=742054 RepID=A0A7X5BXA0_9BACL|nr:epoxide hydrolase family protein [Paenibacillus sacheonensis]MBM7564964.1 pimeloyl-ACP methyl ester carboxylesterase [Paenibacillus sacheonensis]NBC70248.1 epoxide hydrolase [Paenibacillus sacheonensis]
MTTTNQAHQANQAAQSSQTPLSGSEIRPFRIQIAQAELDDLKQRLANTRWLNGAQGSDWKYGVAKAYLKDLVGYWHDSYDWRKFEARLNEYPQYVTNIDGADIHFMHVTSPEPNAVPLILTHGFPSSIAEFLDVIGPLTNPRAYGGDPADAFHLVIPSVPGYGFSGSSLEEGWNITRIAQAWNELMGRLGYDAYGSHGSDLGALVSRELGLIKPQGLLAIHVLQLFSFPSGDPAEMANLTEEDGKRLQFLANFHERAGFNAIQSTRPQTLSYGLADSPVGQLAWIAELFNGFGDHIDFIDRDSLLTNTMIYWLTNTMESAARLYYENAHLPSPSAREVNASPTGIAVFGNDFKSIGLFARRDNSNIVQWSEFERGTHFAAYDEPRLLASELQSFFRRFR